MPTTTVVANDAAFWEWLRNKVRKDKQADNERNAPISLELPVDDPSLVVVPLPTAAETEDPNNGETTTEVNHVVYQF